MVVSNSVTTTNVFATRYYGDGGLLSNISSSAITQPFANLVVSNSVTTTNVFATTANVGTLNVWQISNLSTLSLTNNLVVSNSVTTTNVLATRYYGDGGLLSNVTATLAPGSSQGVLYTLLNSYTLPTAFASGTAGPTMNGYHVNLTSFVSETGVGVTMFSSSSGMLKFATNGLYQVTCVIVGDQALNKVAIGKTSTYTTWTALQAAGLSATAGYEYVYNMAVGSSPSTVITVPLLVSDISQYYYFDVFLSTIAGAPTVLYPTRSTSAAGSNYGTYIQVMPFGSYVSSATSPSAGLLMTTTGTTLSAPRSSNTYRIAMTSANNWTVNGTSTAISITSGGNFQVNQAGIYEVSLCVNADATPVQFGLGSIGSDTSPSGIGPYLYQYAPMYTQDPTTVISLPVNITSVSSYYYIDVTFPLTTSTASVSSTSTYVMIRPIGTYLPAANQVWSIQGSTAYYNGGKVGIGVNPSLTTETLTVSGNTSFVGNVTVTSDVSGSSYVTSKRVPTGSLDVTKYVTGSVPLTTTTNLIQNYLSNTANVVTSGIGGYGPALGSAGTASSWAQIPYQSAVTSVNTSNIFLEAWVYMPTVVGLTSVFAVSQGVGDDWGFRTETTGSLQLYVVNTLAAAYINTYTSSLTTNAWRYVAASFDSVGLKMYTFVAPGTTTATIAGNGTGTGFIGTPRLTVGNNLAMLGRTTELMNGYIYDLRIYKGGIVPKANFTISSANPYVFGSSQPSYITGTPTLHMSLNTQYFPGASTSPYGPCLTLPGTVGSYYSNVNAAFDTNWKTNGFCLEAWVNYASLASSNAYNTASYPYMIGHMFASGGGSLDWSMGPVTTGQVSFYWNNGTQGQALVSSGTITTGSWNHLMVQCNGSNVYLAINGTLTTLSGTGQNYSPAGGNGTTAPSAPSTFVITAGVPITVGNYFGNPCPNFAIAKARLVFGTTGTNGNVYSSGNFTPSPNFNQTLPSGATIAWQLDSQYPLPTFPSIQDVTPLPSQLTSYGSIPTPIGGVTSNVLGPLTSFPQLDSIRFDGTGYIDYGNAASSALTTNLWANAWTIEGWVYLANAPVAPQNPGILSRSSPSVSGVVDWSFYMGGGNPAPLIFTYGSGSLVYNYNASVGVPPGTWTHVAVTYDGSRSNVYVGGALSNSMVATTTAMTFNPAYGVVAGCYGYGLNMFNENLADVRVSNVARYSGTTYVVPSAPFSTDSSTLLLLKSLGGQVGTTLEVQGRGLNSTSIGGTRTVQSYPPAPMSSYLLDTTSNASVTYGQGKYVVSASSEDTGSQFIWKAFDKAVSTYWAAQQNEYSTSSPYAYVGSATTVDILGNAYRGAWIQLQLPVSVLLSSYTIQGYDNSFGPGSWYLLGSRDGFNWTTLDRRIGVVWSANPPPAQTFTTSATQAYTYYRCATTNLAGNSTGYGPDFIEWTLNGTEESLCITSDSKVGVGIANPQRALEVAGDLVVSGTISGGAGMGAFRNRIINGDMRITQRGTSFTGVNNTTVYGIDRWNFYMYNSGGTAGTLTMTRQTLTASDTPYQLGLYYSARITAPNGWSGATGTGITTFAHPFEGYTCADLQWGTSFGQPVTMSFWCRTNVSGRPNVNINLVNSGAVASYCNLFQAGDPGVWSYVTLTIQPPPNGSTPTSTTNGLWWNLSLGSYASSPTGTAGTWGGTTNQQAIGTSPIFATAGNYIEFTGVQLEKGTVATPFEFRPYATELALCQRYYQVIGQNQSSQIYYAAGMAYTTSAAYLSIPLGVSMRIPPASVTSNVVSNYKVLATGIGGTAATSITLTSPSSQTAGLNIGTGAVLTAGQGVLFYADNGSTLGFSAEL